MSDFAPSMKPSEDIVVSGAVAEKPLHHKRNLLIVVAAALLLLLIAGYYIKAAHDRRITADNQAYIAAVSDSMTLRGERRFAEARKPLQAYVDTGRGQQNKIYALVNIATIYETEQKEVEALRVYRQAEQLSEKEEYIIDIGIARTSSALGEKQAALEYYKRSISMLENENQQSRVGDIRSIRTTMKQVETLQ